MLKIAIIGCGKIADQHIHAITRIPNCRVVAVCDREVLMARQLAERFGILDSFADAGEMLRVIHPDVVHITTPPQSHFSLARQCLEAGSHIYLEKPFTITSEEAETLINLVEDRGLKITAGHNYQFTLEMLEMRRLVAQGFLGGKPAHLESHWTYDLGDTSYVGALLGNKQHWVRQLPGRLLHNIISHPVAKLAEFLDDELEEIVATAHQSSCLRRLGGGDVLDELRVLIRDRSGASAYLCFSTQLRPGLNQFRICGPANSLVVDQTSGSLIRIANRPAKSYLTYVVPPLRNACEHFRNARLNVSSFLRRRLYQDFGMTELITRFYAGIRQGGPPALPYREILLTARIMDQIFAQIYSTQPAEKTGALMPTVS